FFIAGNIEKKAKGYTEKKYITDDYFVPKAQYLPKISEIALPETEIIQKISQTAIAFDSIANFAEESFLERVGEAKVVLFGEASHGTSEFYLMRQQLTKALIEKKGFNIVSTEADWPDMELVNNYVQGSPEEKPGTIPFKRFPHWMWRNLEFMDFMEWLKKYNATHSKKVAIYGLDLYGLENSLNHVVRFLENKDSEITALAKKHYSCISPFLQEPAEYGKMVLTRQIESCEAEVLQMLLKLLKERERLNHSPAYFYACQNARLIVDAERYYRIMYYGGADSWNLRDLHMFYTLKSLLTFHGSDSKAVVWAHNSHIGNALATQMYARGEINIGHLCRETFGERSYHVGFGTHTGTVAAADEWGGAMKIKQVNPSLPASYENLSHQTGIKNFSLPLRHSPEVLKQSLSHPKLERAIGVIYRPDTERISHYFHASLSNQFDEYIWFDTTQAVNALAEAKEPLELPMLHPFAAID
ncbi:MAG: erythromycin esterase family protein, partial [Cyanobacteria bacterium J083]